jgi:hypothetical protein
MKVEHNIIVKIYFYFKKLFARRKWGENPKF